MATPSRMQQYAAKLDSVMTAFLACEDGNEGMRILQSNPDVKASIFGRNWAPTRQEQNLLNLKKVVRNVKSTMFRGPQHMFCVSVTPTEPQHGDPACWVPKRHANAWTYEVPQDKEIRVHVRTLFDGSTPPLRLFWRTSTGNAVADEAYREQNAWVNGKNDNELELSLKQEASIIEHMSVYDNDTQILSFKNEQDEVMLKLAFHTAASRPPPPSHAYEDRLTHASEHRQHGSRADASADQTARLCKLLAALQGV